MSYFKFNDEVHFYQTFIKNNLYILGDLILVKEQLNIDNRYFIDMLAYDKTNKKIIIIELKNNKKDDRLINQVISYYDIIKKSNLQDIIKDFALINDINIDKIDLTPLIYIVMPDFNKQLLQNLNYVNINNIKVFKINAIKDNDKIEIIKEEYIPSNINTTNTINDNLNNFSGLDDYILNPIKKSLIQQLINYLKNIYKCNIFFLKNKISIYYHNKLIMQILINKNTNLSLLIKDNIILNNILYNDEILEYKVLNNYVRIEVNQIPIKTLNLLMRKE